MTRPALLFTAPYDFLGSLRPYLDEFTPTFKEVWTREMLPQDLGFRFWVPNPGQHFVIDGEVLDGFPSLTAIASPSTGINHIDRPACAERGIEWYSLLDDREGLQQISASAEFSFLLVLNALRRIDIGLEAVRSGKWRDDERRFRGRELAGRRVGLVGCGRIGRRLARYFEAFECEVRAYEPYADVPPGVHLAEELTQLFETSDIIVVCCALTNETTRMIGGDLVGRMPEGAVLVNSARGEILREEEISALLQERSDLLVATDVVTGEVDGSFSRSPLYLAARDGRVSVTPHIAGATVESQEKAARIALRLLVERQVRRSLERKSSAGRFNP